MELVHYSSVLSGVSYFSIHKVGFEETVLQALLIVL